MPITLAEAKQHLNVTTDDDDALIASTIEEATAYVQPFVTVDLSGDDVPAGVVRAVKLVVASFYDDRGSAPSPDFLGLLGDARKWAF